MIYSPGIVIFKEDTDGCPVLNEEEWKECDIAAIAAPIIKSGNTKPDIIKSIFKERFERFFASASAHGATVAITGAFGCGAFHNDPMLVAEVLKEVIEKYKKKFKVIELAIYTNKEEDKNWEAFEKYFGKN